MPPYIPRLRTDQRHLTIAPSGSGYAPKPTVITLAGALEDGLDDPAFNAIGETLAASRGAVHASIELPGHGHDPAGDGLPEWARRIGSGNDLIGEFLIELRSLVDGLLRLGCTDAQQLAIVGISRGGFLALHAVASGICASCVAIAPVTTLGALVEFQALVDHPYVVESHVKNTCANLPFYHPLYIAAGHVDPRVDSRETMAYWQTVTAIGSPNRAVCSFVPAHDHMFVDRAQVYAEAASWLAAQWT